VELVALGPDVILASGDHSVVASQQATRTVPIVFTVVSDPVGTGYVASLARPGGNMTGFTLFEYSTSAKYLEVLKEIAPGVKRAAVVREAGTATGTGQFAAIQAAAPALGVELSAIGVRDAGEIEGSIAAFARSPNSGLIVTGSAPAAIHSDLIVALAAHHKLPAAYFARLVVAAGGLISYGPDFLDVHRRPALTSIASSKARSRLTYQCRRRPNTSWLSTSRLPRHSAWKYRRRYLPAPTR
jgi:putative ABC transport system substrate-binding protein